MERFKSVLKKKTKVLSLFEDVKKDLQKLTNEMNAEIQKAAESISKKEIEIAEEKEAIVFAQAEIENSLKISNKINQLLGV